MKIYLAWIQEDNWDTEPINIGCYSTEEKAKEAIIKALKENGEDVLNVSTLEIYDTQLEANYFYGIEEYNLDE